MAAVSTCITIVCCVFFYTKLPMCDYLHHCEVWQFKHIYFLEQSHCHINAIYCIMAAAQHERHSITMVQLLNNARIVPIKECTYRLRNLLNMIPHRVIIHCNGFFGSKINSQNCPGTTRLCSVNLACVNIS